MENKGDPSVYRARHSFLESDYDCASRVGVAAICSLLQSAATAHADVLGVGMADFLGHGVTWMLLGMRIAFERWPAAHEEIVVKTWPSGIRGKLVCHRDFLLESAGGERLVCATSDWGCVDFSLRKIARLPPEALALASRDPGTRVGIEPLSRPEKPDWQRCAEIRVRRADMDVNRHVNNVRYAEWLLEPMTDEAYSRRLLRLDISYRQEAVMGDTILSAVSEGESGAAILHRMTRKSDGVLVADACSLWA